MIRNEAEYQVAVGRLVEERRRLADHRERLKAAELSPEEIERVMDPMDSFYAQLSEEITTYDRLKRGDFNTLHNLSGLGNLLIALRISQNISQRELAER